MILNQEIYDNTGWIAPRWCIYINHIGIALIKVRTLSNIYLNSIYDGENVYIILSFAETHFETSILIFFHRNSFETLFKMMTSLFFSSQICLIFLEIQILFQNLLVFHSVIMIS